MIFMDISPTSERSSFKAIPLTESFGELQINSEGTRILTSEFERLNHVDELTTPIKVSIHFQEGSGYAGTFPSSNDQTLWPGPRGGAFIWLSSSAEDRGFVQNKQKVKLHRLEFCIAEKSDIGRGDEETVALYSCRGANLERTSPTVSFFNKIFTSPKRTLIHPSSTLNNLETQKRCDFTLLADFPFGALGGRDPRPVIWNASKGNAVEFDPKSLKIRGDLNLLAGGVNAVSREPVYDEVTGKLMLLQRREKKSTDRNYVQYRLIVLMTNFPSLATFMAPRSMSLNLLAADDTWLMCSPILADRRLFYLVNRLEGKLMAVYQSCSSKIRRFVRLKSLLNGNTMELIVLMDDGGVRKYLMPRVSVEVARFDGAAGLLTSFPVAEFETINDGPFDQIYALPDNLGFIARTGSILLRLNQKFEPERTHSMAPLHLSDFSCFSMTRDGQVVISVMGCDPYLGRISMELIDGGDMTPMAKIPLGSHSTNLFFTPPIYIPTRNI